MGAGYPLSTSSLFTSKYIAGTLATRARMQSWPRMDSANAELAVKGVGHMLNRSGRNRICRCVCDQGKEMPAYE